MNSLASEKTSENSAETNAFNGSLVVAVFHFFREMTTPRNRKATFILMYAALALTVWKYIPAAPRLADESGRCVFDAAANATDISALDFLWNARKIWTAFFLMGVFPALFVKHLFREKLADYGLSWGERVLTIRTFLIWAPILTLVGWASGADKAFYAVYPFNPTAGVSCETLVLHSISYLFLYYFAWEFMFRGFMQRGLSDAVGPTTAVWIQVVASTMLHYGHPASETFGCIAGGLLWGFFALRTKSILSGWGQHALLGIALDWSLVSALLR